MVGGEGAGEEVARGWGLEEIVVYPGWKQQVSAGGDKCGGGGYGGA